MDNDKRVTLAQLGALGVGLTVTIVSSLLTGPIGVPFNILISLALGSAAGWGTLMVLDPRTQQDVREALTNAEYRRMLQQIADIATRMGEVDESLRLTSPEISDRVGHIARMIGMILDRYQERRRDYAVVSNTMLILQRFDEILVHYLKIKGGELFLDKAQSEKEIVLTEKQVIPMFEMALETLGRKLDAEEAFDKGISKETLESMIRSLNLIESLRDQIVSPPQKGDSR